MRITKRAFSSESQSARFFMKTIHAAKLSSLLLLSLPGCLPDSNTTAADEARRALESSQSAYEQQAAEMQRQSDDLKKQVAELQQNLKDKENAELKAKLEAIQRENDKLVADAAAAQKRSEELRDQLAAANTKPAPPAPTIVPLPIPTPAPTPAPAPAPIANQPWSDPDADYSMFYNSLSPHGRWLEVDGYGYAFRPSYSDRLDWRPYVDGRWVWTDQGWAWDTPEPIGWACYHYGRWVRISRHGWVWLPGRQWAPAWVSWRRSPEYIGWAPLPPSVGHVAIGHDCDARYGLAPTSYTFIQASRFGSSSYRNICVSSSTIPSFFHLTLNVTNIVQVNHNQSTLFMHRGGPELDWVEQRCGTRITRAPIHFSSILDRPYIHSSGSSAGMSGFMAAPMPGRRSGPGPSMPKISERVSRPVFADDWKDIPEAIRDRLRDGISKEARGTRPQPILTVMPPEAKKNMPMPERPGSGKDSGGLSGIRQPKDSQTDRPPVPSKSKLPMPEVRPGIPFIEKPKETVPSDGLGEVRKPIDIGKPRMTSPGFQDTPIAERVQPGLNTDGMKGRNGSEHQFDKKSRKEQENTMIARQEIERRRAQQAEDLRKQPEMQEKPVTIPPATMRPSFPGTNNGTVSQKPKSPMIQNPDTGSLQRQKEIQNQINLQRMKQQDALRRAQMEAIQRQKKPIVVPQPKIQMPPSINNKGTKGSGSSQGIRGTTQVMPQRKMPGFTPQIIPQQKKKPQN